MSRQMTLEEFYKGVGKSNIDIKKNKVTNTKTARKSVVNNRRSSLSLMSKHNGAKYSNKKRNEKNIFTYTSPQPQFPCNDVEIIEDSFSCEKQVNNRKTLQIKMSPKRLVFEDINHSPKRAKVDNFELPKTKKRLSLSLNNSEGPSMSTANLNEQESNKSFTDNVDLQAMSYDDILDVLFDDKTNTTDRTNSQCTISPKKSFCNSVDNTFKNINVYTLNSSPIRKQHQPSRCHSSEKSPLKGTAENVPNSPTKSQIQFSPRRLKFALKSPSPKKKGTFSPKNLFSDECQHIKHAIENLNLVRQRSLGLNQFNLEEIYANKQLCFQLGDLDTKCCKKFELNDLVFPREKHADHLMKIVMEVFSRPINCGYFQQAELDFIFSLFTLSAKTQMLFVRLLKRKRIWRRIGSIKYPEISEDLVPYAKELVEHNFCMSDISELSTLELLNLLQADEIRQLCQRLKIDHRGTKPLLISKLMKHSEKKSLFPGAISPKSALQSNIYLKLGTCISLTSNVINIFDRIFTLLHPAQDPSESIADFFFILTSTDKGEILFPLSNIEEHYPIFRNRQHLLDYVKSKNKLFDLLEAIENKDWETVRTIGRLAHDQLIEAQSSDTSSSLPLHVRKFIPEYIWAKVLSKSVESFKKTPETIPEAVNILHTLIREKNHVQSSKGRWYSELALIEMHHKKDLESSAEWTMRALEQENLTDVDVSDLIDRLRKLLRRKTGITAETKAQLLRIQESIEEKGLIPQPTITKTISASMAARNETGGKSTWSIVTNGNFKGYGSVELLALNHYTSEEEFYEGLHCEGALPVTLFTVFFWSELFDTSVPGVFVSAYQEAPLDLFTAEFFDNRKEKIEDKIETVRSLDLESFSDWMTDEYMKYNKYKSVMTNNLFKSEQDFRDVVKSLGIIGVSGICERLASNFCLWRSGFPDLVIWNPLFHTCKIVEVKGPGDSLSVKQKLWLQYLLSLGINVEVCHVEATGMKSK